MKRKERSRNLQTAEHLCTLNEGEGRRGGEKGGRTMASQRCDRTPKGSRVVYMHVCVCGNGQKCARLCVYVHEEGAGQEASINSRFSPTSRVHWACLRIQ